MKRIVGLVIMVSLALGACDTDSNLNNCDFDETGMLTNYADGVIQPRFNDLVTATTLLKGSVDAFVSTPTIGLLNEARITFRAAYNQYQRCSQFAFGPGLINGVPFRDRFNTFPTNTSILETSIENGTAVTASPQSVVGFPAVDYLLFGTEGETDQQILDKFTTVTSATNRIAFLVELAAELQNTSESIADGWIGYRSQFIGNTGSSNGSSISTLVNEFNRDYEIMKNFKFKVPLGKLNGGVALPDKVEAFYSGISTELSESQTEAIREFYLGISESGVDGLGLDDYLECLQTESGDKLLSEAISDQFQLIFEKLDLVADPLSEELVNNKPLVDDAYQAMQDAVPMIKHEMTTAFGVQINYESGDGD
jgi:predicted lipoprotein